MGTWGTGIFSDDEACDVRDLYRDFLGDGLDDVAALAGVVSELGADDPAALDANTRVALALTLHRYGRLTPDVRANAIAVIDAGPDERWNTPALVRSRNAALERARATLDKEQPARRRVSKPWRPTTSIVAGTVLALRHDQGVTLLRVLRVDTDRYGADVVVATLDYSESALPNPAVLEQLADRPVGTQPPTPAGDGRPPNLPSVQALTRNHKFELDHAAAGFEEIGFIAPRPGDVELRVSDVLVWEHAAELMDSGEWFEVRDDEFWFLKDE